MITTNLFKSLHAVLLDSEGKIIAIIKCPKNGDITKQLQDAIAEDKCLDVDDEGEVTIADIIEWDGSELTFSAEWIQDGAGNDEEFSLTIADIY